MLSRFAVVELEQPAEPAVAQDRLGAGRIGMGFAREEDHVSLALMRALVVVMLEVIIECAAGGWRLLSQTKRGGSL